MPSERADARTFRRVARAPRVARGARRAARRRATSTRLSATTETTTTTTTTATTETTTRRGEHAIATTARADAASRLATTTTTETRRARELRRALPDAPAPVVDASARASIAIERTLGPAWARYAPARVRETVAAQARAERASGYALYAGDGGPEAELAIYAAAAFYLIAKPGVVPWAFDQTVANAVGRALERRFDAASVRRGRRLGAGSFGTVFEAEDSKSGRTVVVKQSNAVEGASELQNAEAYINRRVARAPLVAAGCAKFLGTYYEVEGARSPCLVWAREEGDATLEDFLEDRGFPDALEDALGIRARDGDDEAKRANRCAKKIMRDLLGTVAALHDIGIVHRDLKPSNLVLMGKRFKLIDFGAACDLRSGENYDPEQGLLDPKYSPPEQFIMSEKTPAPPPLVAGVLAPLLWTIAQPQLFDSYSAGLILLQLGVPQLRGKNVMAPNGAFQRRLEDAGYDLRKWRADVESALNWDFSALDVNGGIAWDLACRLVTKRNILRRGRLDVGAALAHPFLLA